MSSNALRSFAQAATRHRTELFGGHVDDAGCDAHGRNLQLGTTLFRAPFTRLLTAIDIRIHGKSIRCTAVALIPNSLGLTLDESTLITHIASGDVFEVVQIGIEHPASAERRVLLRRQEP